MLITMKTEIRTSLLSTSGVDSLFDILRAVSEVTLIKQKDIRSRIRLSEVCNARFMFCWVAKHHGGFTLKQIGDAIGGRDHSSVIHSVRTCQQRITNERHTRETVQSVMSKLSRYTSPRGRTIEANEIMVPLQIAAVFAVSYIDFFFNTLNDEFKQMVL